MSAKHPKHIEFTLRPELDRELSKAADAIYAIESRIGTDATADLVRRWLSEGKRGRILSIEWAVELILWRMQEQAVSGLN